VKARLHDLPERFRASGNQGVGSRQVRSTETCSKATVEAWATLWSLPTGPHPWSFMSTWSERTSPTSDRAHITFVCSCAQRGQSAVFAYDRAAGTGKSARVSIRRTSDLLADDGGPAGDGVRPGGSLAGPASGRIGYFRRQSGAAGSRRWHAAPGPTHGLSFAVGFGLIGQPASRGGWSTGALTEHAGARVIGETRPVGGRDGRGRAPAGTGPIADSQRRLRASGRGEAALWQARPGLPNSFPGPNSTGEGSLHETVRLPTCGAWGPRDRRQTGREILGL
jgi:hypothetical protein